MHSTASRGTLHGISHSTLTCSKCLIAFISKAMVNTDLSPDDRVDCASEFIAKFLIAEECILAIRYAGCDQCRNLLSTCAHNHFISFQIRRCGVTQHEISLSTLSGESKVNDVWDKLESVENPETIVLRKGFWDRIRKIMEPLSQEQRDLIIRHYKNEESLEDISLSTGRTKHALSQALYAAIRHLQKLMEEEGIERGDL